jgi:hypothetical protein
VVCASLPVFEVKEPETPVREVAVDSRVEPSEVKESLTPKTPRINKSEMSQSEAPHVSKQECVQSGTSCVDKPAPAQVKEPAKPVKEVVFASRVTPIEAKETLPLEMPLINKQEYVQSETPHVSKQEYIQSETPRVDKPAPAQVKEPETPVREAVTPSLAPVDEKPEVGLIDIASARVSQNTVVQTPESAVVSRLVETVVETIAVTPTLSSNGEGEIRIKLKSDILDGSSIKIEVKNGELKIVVEPASRVAEEILLKSHEAFQNQLAERVTAWRINVGVAAFDLRNNLRRRLEELS